MKKLSCFIKGFAENNRFTYFAAAENGEKAAEAQKQAEVPEARRLTAEHINQVLNAVDTNIRTVEAYYRDPVNEVRNLRMPPEVGAQIVQLKQLRYQLEAAKQNPAGSRRLLTEIYAIFNKLDDKAQANVGKESAAKDPLATFGYTINRPELTPATTGKEREAAARAEKAEREQYALQLFNSAVKIFVSGGPIGQNQLDAVKAQFAKEGRNTIARTVVTERGKIDVYMTLSKDGTTVNAIGVLPNPRKVQEQGQLTKTQFNIYVSLDANQKNAPEFDVPPVDKIIQRVASSKKELPTIA
jgi:hypothetical protein